MYRLISLTFALSTIPTDFSEAKTVRASDTLELSGDFIIPVTINGKAYRWEVEPEGGAARIVNADVAKALALKPSLISGLHMIGPVRLEAASDSVRIDYGGTVKKDRLLWFNREASAVSDGAIHPTMLPHSTVRFNFGPKTANERETVMPLEGGGMFGIGGGYGKFAYGDIELQISFSFKRYETLMTAPVGVELAAGHSGTFLEQQRQTLIRFGVERPVRLLRFGRPLLLFDRPVTTALVRVSDFGDASTIPDDAAVDNDEIVVTGNAKKKTRYSLTLGRDFLRGCSSLTYDMKAKLIRLSCQP